MGFKWSARDHIPCPAVAIIVVICIAKTCFPLVNISGICGHQKTGSSNFVTLIVTLPAR
jgi:hypothetical protein